jgi:hypothetical protein
MDVTPLAVLGRPNCASGEATPDTYNRVLEIDVVPTERQELALPHPGLQGDETERAIWLLRKVSKEPRKFLVLEICGFLAFGTRPLRRRKFPHGVRVGIAVEDSGLETGTQHTQVFRARGG